MFKDKDGYRYKFPQRSCERCLKNPCIEGKEKLFSDFAKYGCQLYEDENIFN